MLIKILEDNTACSGFIPEWGFSAYIEYLGHRILLDAGQSVNFATNAQMLGVDLAKVDMAVLSHAHYDHVDGFPTFFELNDVAKLYISGNAMENCYKIVNPIKLKYIGIKRGLMNKYATRLIKIDTAMEIDRGIYIVPHASKGLEAIGKRAKMLRRKGLLFKIDDYSHEQSLVFDTERGLVIFSSCSHGGADNIIAEVEKYLPGKRAYALIGGLHLHCSSVEIITDVCTKLNVSGLKILYTGHCTGDNAISILSAQGRFQVVQTNAGQVIEL